MAVSMGACTSKIIGTYTTSQPEEPLSFPEPALHVHPPRTSTEEVKLTLQPDKWEDYSGELLISSIDRGLVRAEFILGAPKPRGLVFRVEYKRLLLFRKLAPCPGPLHSDLQTPLGFISLPPYIDPWTIDLDLCRCDGLFKLSLDAQVRKSYMKMLDLCGCDDCVRRIGQTQTDVQEEEFEEQYQPFEYEVRM